MTEQPPKPNSLSALTPKTQTLPSASAGGIRMGAPLNLNRPANTAANPFTEYLIKNLSRVNISTPTHLGALIKSSRVAKKLTQQQLADLAGVGRRFIVECEAGKPRLEFAKVLQVAAAAGIDIFAIKR
jgi:y4mF family transcriptional regulator